MKTESRIIVGLIACLLTGAVVGCGPTKLQQLETKKYAAQLALSRNEIVEERRVIEQKKRDTIKVNLDGQELILMNAIQDEQTGESVAHEILNAAVITARFRNVAERHGKIDLRFEVIVPPEMMDPKWQLQFYPDMFIMEDSIRLEPVVITGTEFRKKQLRGYEAYNKYISSIIRDTSAFIDYRSLNTWIARNIPELYAFKNDTSFVDTVHFNSLFGASEEEAIRHYTNWHKRRYNEEKWAQRDNKFKKYVKAPILSEGIRMDTVLRDIDSNFVYSYVQTITTRPKLRKVDIVLSGDIFEQENHLYTMPRTEPLTFYISSLSAFVDGTERYLTKVLERRAAANTACYVDFASGKADINMALGHNEEEIGRIRGNILDLLHNTKFDLDSIVISASASPEGSTKMNGALAERRAASVAGYFDKYIKHYRDSVQHELDIEARNTFSLVVDDEGNERATRTKAEKADIPDIKFKSHSNGENWDFLSVLVDEDTTLTVDNKRSYMKYLEIANVDEREKQMQKEPYYKYVRETLYPRLRTVRFDFHLHRKGMVKDTVHTTELDTVYMKGVELLKDRDYKAALEYLRDYRDYNTAIAYVSLDYNASAMAILQELPKTAQVNYMLALLYARNDDDQRAVQYYMDACRQEHSYVFRGNLDPEIYVLIQRYGLNKEDEDDLDGF